MTSVNVFGDMLTSVKKRTVNAHNFPKSLVGLQNSPYLCTVNQREETAANLNKAEAYNLKTVNMTKLCQALNLSKDQIESFTEISNTFSSELLFAAQMNDEERQLMVEKAIKKDLAWMDYILNEDQYRKYVMLLNITLHNRGLK